MIGLWSKQYFQKFFSRSKVPLEQPLGVRRTAKVFCAFRLTDLRNLTHYKLLSGYLTPVFRYVFSLIPSFSGVEYIVCPMIVVELR